MSVLDDSQMKFLLFISLFTFLITDQCLGQLDLQSAEEIEQFVHQVEQTHRHGILAQLEYTGPSTVKCGFGYSFDVVRNWDKFSAKQQQRLTIAFTPNDFQCDTVIGQFRIHFDTSGYNTPALLDGSGSRIPNSAIRYIDSVGKYLDIVWQEEIALLHYADDFLNGQPYYNIYIESLSGIYGETDFTTDDLIDGYTPPRYTSYIRIDNDYQGYESAGMAGLKVTLAHEFHHAVQVGSYGYWSSDQYFYEITSTWMEDHVFTEVNDYCNYLSGGQFAHPDISFRSLSGVIPYSRGIWGMFIEKKYSAEVMHQAWEYIRTEKPIPAMDRALNSVGSSFRQAFLEWTVWNFNTGPGCDTMKYYSEGRAYPAIVYRPIVQYMKSTERSFSDSIQVLSSVYHPICICENDSVECSSCPKMFTIISNLNMTSISADWFGFRYDLAGSAGAGFTQLSNGIYYHLEVSDPENWTSQETLEKMIGEVIVYPNPFTIRGGRPLTFKLPQPVTGTEATLNIFSASMDRIYSSIIPVISSQFEPKLQWNGIGSRGDAITSGIYLYVISLEGKDYKGKFAVVR
jgi:hypothetical protein